MSTRDEWIPVRSLDELFRGCAVRVTDCHWCNGGAHVGTVLSEPRLSIGFLAAGTVLDEVAVETTMSCGGPPGLGIAAPDIEEGRVFRLRPEKTAASSTAGRRVLMPAVLR